MATLKDALKLKKEKGISTRDAIAQIEGNTGTQVKTEAPTVQNLPVQPTGGATIPVAPTVTPTTPTTQPIAKAGDVVVGVGGEKFIQANNYDGSTNVQGQGQVINQSGQALNQMQQIQAESFGRREGANIAPIAPKETITPTSTTVPTTTTTPTTPTLLTDLTKGQQEYGPDGRKVIGYRASHSGGASGYSTADRIPVYEGDQYTPPQDSGTIFNTLRAGGSVPPSDTPEYRQAQARYNTFKKFSTYDVASLSTAMQDGSLLMGTQAYNDVISDPAMLAKVQRARAFTSGNVDLNVIGEKSGQYVMTSNPTVAKALSDGNMSQEEYDSLTNNPEVEAQAKVVSEARAKYDDYKRQLEDISDTVDEEYKTDNEIFRNAVKSNLDKSIRRLYNSASDDLQNALGTYTELKNSSTALLEINMKQYESQQAEQRQIAQEARQQKYSQENAILQAGLAQKNALFQNTLQQSNASFQTIGDKVYKVQNEQMTETGIKAEPNASYQSFGGKLYKIKGDSVTEVPGISTEAPQTQKWGVIGKNSDGTDKYGFINEKTGMVAPYLSPTGAVTGDLRYLADQFPNQAWAKNNNPAGITWNANFDKGTGTAKLFADAGIQFSKGTARPANEGGNYVTFATIEDGLKAQQILMTQTYGNSSVGDMLSSWVGTSEGPNYAKQVAGMAGITDLTQKVSSLSPEQVSALQMAKIKKESPGLANLLTKEATNTPSSQYTDQNINDLAYLVELQEKNPTQAAKEMKDLGYDARDMANYKAGNVPLTEKQKTSSINLANSIKDLLTNYDYTDATGMHFFDEAPRGSDWASAEEKIKTIVANMTLPNLGMLKGPMSDKDLAFIQAASSNLATSQSDTNFGNQLVQAYNLAARRAGLPEVTSLDQIKTQSTQPTPQNTATGGGQTIDPLGIR